MIIASLAKLTRRQVAHSGHTSNQNVSQAGPLYKNGGYAGLVIRSLSTNRLMHRIQHASTLNPLRAALTPTWSRSTNRKCDPAKTSRKGANEPKKTPPPTKASKHKNASSMMADSMCKLVSVIPDWRKRGRNGSLLSGTVLQSLQVAEVERNSLWRFSRQALCSGSI